MNVVFVEPAFPPTQRQFVRALAETGAYVIGIGERPGEWLDDELRGWLSRLPPGRQRDRRRAPDRLRPLGADPAVGGPAGGHDRGAHAAGGPGPGGVHDPRHQRPDGLAVPGQAVDEGGAAGGGRADRGLDRRRARGRDLRVRRRGRLPADPQAAHRRRRARTRPGRRPRAARRRAGRASAARRRVDRGGGVRRGPRGLLRHVVRRRAAAAGLLSPLLPERARGDADAVDLAAVRLDQPDRPAAGLPASCASSAAGQRGARHRHHRDPHGVVLRSEGAEVLRDRLPPARASAPGTSTAPATRSTSTARGPRRSCTGTSARPVPPVRRRHRRAAARTATAASPATTGSTRRRPGSASG